MSNNRRLIALLIAGTLLLIFHAPILRLVMMPLARMDRPDPSARYLLFLRSAKSADSAYAFAHKFANQDPDNKLLLFHDYVRRAESIGAAPSFLDVSKHLLIERGIPPEQIEVIGQGHAITVTEKFQVAAEWLKQHPDERLLVATQLLRSGKLVDVANATLSKSERARVRVLGFRRPRIEYENWWRSRTGIKEVLRHYLQMIHYWLVGELRPKLDWDPDAYETMLKDQRDA